MPICHWECTKLMNDFMENEKKPLKEFGVKWTSTLSRNINFWSGAVWNKSYWRATWKPQAMRNSVGKEPCPYHSSSHFTWVESLWFPNSLLKIPHKIRLDLLKPKIRTNLPKRLGRRITKAIVFTRKFRTNSWFMTTILKGSDSNNSLKSGHFFSFLEEKWNFSCKICELYDYLPLLKNNDGSVRIFSKKILTKFLADVLWRNYEPGLRGRYQSFDQIRQRQSQNHLQPIGREFHEGISRIFLISKIHWFYWKIIEFSRIFAKGIWQLPSSIDIDRN